MGHEIIDKVLEITQGPKQTMQQYQRLALTSIDVFKLAVLFNFVTQNNVPRMLKYRFLVINWLSPSLPFQKTAPYHEIHLSTAESICPMHSLSIHPMAQYNRK